MKFEAVKSHIIRCYRAGLRRTVYLSGPPGVGKTACAEAAAHALGISLIAWPMTVVDPLDLGGMPAVLDAGNGPYAARLPFADLIPSTGAGILVLDDLPTAPPLTQAAAYRLIWERAIGSMRLGDDWLIVATGNRDQDRAATQRMPTPLVSKMGWLEFEPDVDAWVIEMAGREGAPVVRAFIHTRPDLFITFDPARPGPYATARTWEAVSELCAAYGERDLPPFEAITGWIGEGPAVEFTAYASMAAQLVSPDTILLSPESADVPDDPGALYAVTSALAAKATAGNFDRIATYLGRLMPEFAVYTVKSAIAGQRGRLEKLSPDERKRYRLIEQTAAFVTFAAKNQDLLS